jgi:prophage regulatory protein
VSARLLRFREVQARTGLSRSTLNRRVADGSFPKPIPLFGSSHMVGFIESEVDSWITEQIRRARPDGLAQPPAVA